ncbi:virulence factor [Gallibacterium anatis]|jgi:virulence-associated protein VapD|uniref:CRISPR associated protein Cas2 n=1 Tax=Gallibacterium anatis TaxID=750 RepID=A0A0A3AEF9_9PAST|nr:virulence factor [Gallibacterium anatis]KGQ40190.1 virulence factor [Gallibacterium anatis]KGQ42029.1 virulence factor [Gallibacterium anatis IPDH697-78]KGQ53080.1 virulence factor [Gallibacterium anatis DSM 16844 = F 149]KGQ66132.1 virulence factor [Gallibacterium anatis]OBW94526.1 virulence factor [Gallibacterium anatis]
MDRTLIVFDMDTHCLEENYHNASWRNAYTDIQRILKKHGFTNIQGTVYLSDVGVKQAHGTLALQEVAVRCEWFAKCASNIQFYDLKDDFNAQFIVDGVQAAREAFNRSIDALRKELLDAGLSPNKVEEIIGKRAFSLQYIQENQLIK